MQDIIFLFLPLIAKNFSFESFENREDEIEFLDFSTVNRKNKTTEENLKKIAKELGEDEGEWKKMVLINFPYNVEQVKLLKKLFLKKSRRLEKHIILVNITKYEVLEEIQSKCLVCPTCERLHLKKKRRRKK